MALLRACVTDTPVTLRLDSKVETAGTVVLVLIPTSVAAPQEAWQSVTARVKPYDPPLLLHRPVPSSTASNISPPPSTFEVTTCHSHSADTFHILHKAGSHPAGTKIESLTDTAFSAPLGK